MPIDILKVDSYKITSTDIFFFDNNIWMYLFCPIGNHEARKQRKYSALLQELISRKIHIYTNSLTISEFVNSFLRLDFNIERKKVENAGKYNDFKLDYFPSARGHEIRKQVNINVAKIMGICQKNSDEFPSIDINSILELSYHIGFNDSYYLYLANKKNWRIVTDDGDFTQKLNALQTELWAKSMNIKILSA